jgi:hypothetical protein
MASESASTVAMSRAASPAATRIDPPESLPELSVGNISEWVDRFCQSSKLTRGVVMDAAVAVVSLTRCQDVNAAQSATSMSSLVQHLVEFTAEGVVNCDVAKKVAKVLLPSFVGVPWVQKLRKVHQQNGRESGFEGLQLVTRPMPGRHKDFLAAAVAAGTAHASFGTLLLAATGSVVEAPGGHVASGASGGGHAVTPLNVSDASASDVSSLNLRASPSESVAVRLSAHQKAGIVSQALDTFAKTPPSENYIELLFSHVAFHDHLQVALERSVHRGILVKAVEEAVNKRLSTLGVGAGAYAGASAGVGAGAGAGHGAGASGRSESPFQSASASVLNLQPFTSAPPTGATPVASHHAKEAKEATAADAETKKRKRVLDVEDRKPARRGDLVKGEFILVQPGEDTDSLFWLAEIVDEGVFAKDSTAPIDDASVVLVRWWQIARHVGSTEPVDHVKAHFEPYNTVEPDEVTRASILCSASFEMDDSLRAVKHKQRLKIPVAEWKWLRPICLAASLTPPT